MKDITVDQWKSQIAEDNEGVILDVRTQDEVDEGSLENAVHIDIYLGQGFVDEVQKLDKSKNYYVYCRSGGRSAQACQVMNELGFETTYNMLGGYTEWEALKK
jgi:rhodanese-related sulfurtransferase